MDLLKIRRQLCDILILDLNNQLVYFDVEKEEFSYLNQEEFEDFYQKYDCVEDINEEELSGSDAIIFNLIINNREKVISVMPCHFNNAKELAIEFINKKNNEELNIYLNKRFYLSSFLNKIDKLNLKDKWLDFVYLKEYNAIDHLIDGLGIFEIEAGKELYLKLFELANTINELKPWETFSDCDFIEYNGEIEKYYYCVMGNAGQTFGLSIYSKEDLDGLNTIVDNEDNALDPLLLMSMQMNYTIYFDKMDKNREEYLMLKELGIEDKYETLISIFRFKHGIMNRCYLTYHEAYELMNRLENFIAFYKTFKENPVDFDYNNNIHVTFTYKNKIKISKTIINKNNYNCLLDCSNIPLLENININPDATYEIDLRGFQILSLDGEGKKAAAAYLMLIVDAKTGLVLKPIMIDGSRGELFYDIYVELQKYIKDIPFAKKVIVKNKFVANLLKSMFGKNIDVKIGHFNHLEEAYDTLNQMMENERIYN